MKRTDRKTLSSESIWRARPSTAHDREFTKQTALMTDRLAHLRVRANESPTEHDMLVDDALHELYTTIEELKVADEELRQQNDEMYESREAIEDQRHRYEELFQFAPDGYLVTNAHGIIEEANQAASAFLNVPPDFLVGKPLTSFIPVEERRNFRTELLHLGHSDRVVERMVRLKPRKRPVFDAAVTVSAVRDRHNQPLSLRWLLRDATARHHAEVERSRLLMEEMKDYAIFILDLDGRVTSWSAGAELMMGYSAGELVGSFFGRIFTPEDQATGTPDRELATVRNEGRAENARWHVRKDGTRLWASGVITPFHNGSQQGFIKVLRDITRRKKEDERQRFLANLMDRARVHLDPEAVFSEAVTSLAEYLQASRCAYSDIDTDNEIYTVHNNYCRETLSMSGPVQISPFGLVFLGELKDGLTVICNNVYEDARITKDQIAAYEERGTRSFLSVPYLKDGKLVSCLTVVSSVPRNWTPDEVALVETVAERTWLTTDNLRLFRATQEEVAERKNAQAELARIYDRERRIAVTLQRSILGQPSQEEFPELEIETIYKPAWNEAEFGGDYFDIFPLGAGKVAMVVGDVSGKGLEAATRTGEVKFTLRAYLREHISPGATLNRMNMFLCETQLLEKQSLDSFVCLTLFVLDPLTGHAQLAIAGGEPPLILRNSGEIAEAEASGMPLGIWPEARYKEISVDLEVGDIALVATDGISEARNGGEFLGTDGLKRLARQAISLGELSLMSQEILNGAQNFANGALHDDVCLLLVRRK